MKDIELLAPVGSYDALKAAVQNGANAVYLGGKEFSARASANNFDREELKEAVKYAHTRGVQVFVTANTLIKQNEIEDFVEYAKFLYDIDIDAIILQDVGMARLVKKLLPDFEIHASTQMVAHSLEDVVYLQSIGFDRVVLARELNVEEIKYICDNTDVDIEVFVHGALCVCYSGQCLMSSMIGNRSGNRGRCAQPCRQRYELVDIHTGEVVNSNGEYLLSPKDLSTIEELDKIIDAGVLSLKIEGRMKRPEYVATVISSYKEAINQYVKNKKVNISNETINDLYTIFNRKFTKGHILGKVGEDVMNSDRPNNQGLYVGKVLYLNKKTKRLKIALENTLKKGDGINLGGGTIGRIIKGKEITDIGYKGEIIELDFIGEAKRNQLIFKTSDSDLMDRVQSTFMQEKELVKSEIDAELTIKFGEYPRLTLSDLNGNKATIEGDKLVEKAIKVPLSEEKVQTQLEKLGNTPYVLRNYKIDLEDGVSMPISLINQIRRDCIDKLSEERISIKNRNYKDKNVKYSPVKVKREYQPILRVKVKNLEQLEGCLESSIDTIYYEDINTVKEAIEIGKGHSKTVIYSAPRIIRNREFKQLQKAKDLAIENIQVGSWGLLNYFKDSNISVDYYLNTFNSESANHFKDTGIKTVCMSQELNIHELREILKYTDIDVETVVYGYTPLMVTEYCPMGVVARNCNKDKRVAKCKESVYALRNAMGEEYRVSQDIFCRSTIYNSKPMCMLENLEELYNIGVGSFRLDFTLEDKDTVKNVIDSYEEFINEDFEMGKKSRDMYNNILKNEFTEGHYYKGVE